MTIITITRDARCGDCKFIKAIYHGKRKTHKCSNPESKYIDSQVTLKDTACNKWKLF